MFGIKTIINKFLGKNKNSEMAKLDSKDGSARGKERRAENREKCIVSAMSRRGWEREEAEREVDNAINRLGITYVQYNNYYFCNLSEEVQLKKADYIKELEAENKEKINSSIESTMEKLGISRTNAVKKMKLAKKLTGITFENYDKYDFAFLSEEEQQNKYDDVKAEIEKEKTAKNERDKCVWKTMYNRDLDRSAATKEVEEALADLGISYKTYDECLLYRYSPQDKIWAYNSFVERRNKKIKERDDNISATAIAKNCTEEQIISHYKDLNSKYLCSWKEYFTYKLHDADEDLVAKMVFQKHMKKIMTKYNTDRVFTRITDNKEETNKFFAEYLSRKWCVNRDITFEEFKEIFEGVEGVVYKPNYGMQGRGVEAFYFTEGIENVYNKIMSYSRGVVEEMIKQHPEMKKLNPDSVNCLRIVTISSVNKPVLADGRKRDVAYVSVKIGRKGNIADNTTTGGLVANIDLEKGVVATDGVNKYIETAEVHPDTGTKIKGFKIPYYNEAIDYVLKMVDELKLSGSIGWDIAISENGPQLVEPNLGPGISLLQDPWFPHKTGMREYMEKYLWDEQI